MISSEEGSLRSELQQIVYKVLDGVLRQEKCDETKNLSKIGIGISKLHRGEKKHFYEQGIDLGAR